jgi:TetR/AcrR family transcriptional regulator, repressor of fatR-cypB operon
MKGDFLLDAGDAPSKRRILSCALELFVRDGLCETSIRAIGAAAGYTNPALYKFFASKEALALHLFERCYLWVYGRVEAAAARGAFGDRLGGAVRAYVGLLEERPEAVLYVNENLRAFWPRVRPAVRRASLLQVLAALVTQGQREGAVHPGLAPELAVALLVGTLGQVARQASFGDFAGGVRAVEGQLATLLHAALTRSHP